MSLATFSPVSRPVMSVSRNGPIGASFWPVMKSSMS